MTQQAEEYTKMRRVLHQTRTLKRLALVLLVLDALGIILLIVLQGSPWTWLG